MQALLTNKTLWLAVLALVQTVSLKYLGLPQDLWIAIDAILLVVIGSLTVESAAKAIVAELRASRLGLKK
jgi:hypothetical protein